MEPIATLLQLVAGEITSFAPEHLTNEGFFIVMKSSRWTQVGHGRRNRADNAESVVWGTNWSDQSSPPATAGLIPLYFDCLFSAFPINFLIIGSEFYQAILLALVFYSGLDYYPKNQKVLTKCIFLYCLGGPNGACPSQQWCLFISGALLSIRNGRSALVLTTNDLLLHEVGLTGFNWV